MMKIKKNAKKVIAVAAIVVAITTTVVTNNLGGFSRNVELKNTVCMIDPPGN